MTNSSDNKSSDPKNRHPTNSHLQSHSKEYLPDFIKTNSAHKRPPHLGNASQLRQKLNKSNKIAHLISRWAILL